MRHKFSHLVGACCLALTIGGVANAADMQAYRADALPAPSNAISSKAASPTSIYIVQLQGDPIVAYQGDIAGFKATKPGKGKKINPNSKNVKKYAAYLAEQINA